MGRVLFYPVAGVWCPLRIAVIRFMSGLRRVLFDRWEDGVRPKILPHGTRKMLSAGYGGIACPGYNDNDHSRCACVACRLELR